MRKFSIVNFFILLFCSSYVTSYSYYYYDTSSEYETSKSLKNDINMKGNLLKKFAIQAALAHSTSNLVCSPISVLMPLGKLALGVSRKTHELYDAVGVKSRKIKKYFKDLISRLSHVSGVVLNLASKIYLSNRKRVNASFMIEAKNTFGSGCEVLDFGRPTEAARIINEWVYQKTNNRITNIISPSDIKQDASMVIVNAVYFMGRWEHEFTSINKQPFYTPSGTREIDMMHVTAKFKYAKSKSLDAEVIQIPYRGDKTYLAVILPSDKRGLPQLLRQLQSKPDKLNSALERTQTVRVILSLPKFRIETRLDLTRLYEKIGLHRIFSSRETGIDLIVPDEHVYISTAVHKALIEVNDKHTEGAAATVVEAIPMSWTPYQVRFLANRPFLFYVISNKQQIFSGVFNGYSNL